MKTNIIKFTLVAMAATSFMFQSCRKEPITKPGKDGSLESRSYCDQKCYQEETAWGWGCKYVDRGSWATYTKYNKDECTPIYAGQNMYAGSVSFSCVVNGKVKVTINLNNGWELAPGSESVKVQGYNSAPNSKPAPGQFTTYKGNSLCFEVDAYCFYGIHIDVRKEIACE